VPLLSVNQRPPPAARGPLRRAARPRCAAAAARGESREVCPQRPGTRHRVRSACRTCERSGSVESADPRPRSRGRGERGRAAGPDAPQRRARACRQQPPWAGTAASGQAVVSSWRVKGASTEVSPHIGAVSRDSRIDHLASGRWPPTEGSPYLAPTQCFRSRSSS